MKGQVCIDKWVFWLMVLSIAMNGLSTAIDFLEWVLR